jgi:hypothetical protein
MLGPETGPLLTSSMQWAKIGAEELANISSYQTF